MSSQRSRIAFVVLLSGLAAPLWAGKPDPRPALPQVGAAREVRLAPDPARFVTEAPGPEDRRRGGGPVQVWRDSIRIPGAAFLKPRFANFNLAPGDVLIVRAKSGQVVEQLEGLGPRKQGSFWGLSAFGDELHFELRARSRYAKAPFAVEQVMVGDPRVLAEVTESAIASVCGPEDYDDAICYQGDAAKWANVMASAGVMAAGGGIALWCSASNVSPLNYLLTNYHCIPEVPCEDAEFVFKYYRTACNTGAAPNPDWVGYRCGETVASSPLGACDPTPATLDYSLHSVIGDPAASFGFLELDPSPLTSGERIYMVQHAAGRPHEITHGEGADVVVDLSGHTLRYYDTLDTEEGSSGAPIFRESDDRMVGMHHCGGCENAAEGNRGILMSDIYPEIEDFVCSPTLALAAGASQSLAEVGGNGDAFLDPGETWSLRPVLVNRSCSADALAASATVAVGAGSAPVSLLDTAATFGDLAAGASAASQQTIRFVVDAGACAGEIRLDLVAVSSNGGQSHPSGQTFRRELGSVPVTGLLFENFAGGIPGSWTVVDGGDGGGAAATWTTANPGGRSVLVPPFAIADSDELGSFAMDEQLITPAISTDGFSHLSLELEHNFHFNFLGQSEKADIDVRSSATAGNWVNLRRFAGTDASGHLGIDLTPYAASGLQIRFHYYDALFEWYWAIDDVTIRGDHGQVCAGVPFFSDGFEAGNTAAWSITLP